MNLSNFRVLAGSAIFCGLLSGPVLAVENITAVSVDDPNPVPGQDLAVTVEVTHDADGDAWTSTFVSLLDSQNAPVIGSGQCANVPDPDITGIGNVQETVSYTLDPNLPAGDYSVQVSAFRTTDDCTGNGFTGITQLSTAITVATPDPIVTTVPVPNPTIVVAGSGDTATFQIEADNVSPANLTGYVVQVVESAPTGTGLAGFTASAGSFDELTYEWTVDLAAATAATLDLVYEVNANAADGVPITVTTVPTIDESPAEASIIREFDLGLTVVDEPDPVIAGAGVPGNLTHTFTLSRSGPSDAAGVQVDLTPTLVAGVTLDSADPSVGSVAGTTWTVGDWAATENGNDQTLVLTLTVSSSAADCTDCVSAEGTVSAANGTDTNTSNNTAVDPTSIETAASAPTNFPTSITFSNGYTGTVTVMLSCNTGVPLEQAFEIDPANGVTFVIEQLDFVAPTTDCEISLDLASGYTATATANGEVTGGACAYSGTPVAAESAPFDGTTARTNTCVFAAEPVASSFLVAKRWEGLDANFDATAELTIACAPASEDTGSTFGTVSVDVTASGNEDFYLDFYPTPAGTTVCTVTEGGLQSGVESSSTCDSGVPFQIGDAVKTCTVTNTVFFEGIPTLSQYGLALMALLMLGVGFIGLRRFV